MLFQDAPALAGLLEPSGALGFLIPTENARGCLLLRGRQLKELIELNPEPGKAG